MDEMHEVLGEINVYNIYGPCIMSMDENGRKVSTPRAPLSTARKAFWDRAGLGGPDGCIDAGAATQYLDHPEVRKVQQTRLAMTFTSRIVQVMSLSVHVVGNPR